jgi:50S ribosomal protein L16 3-hydroxylase
MLYLPPHCAHYGVAEDTCTTYSIGFRAPTADEMAHAFLDHLQDTLELDGRYADPDLRLQGHPAAIGGAMLDQIEAMIARIRWDRRDVAEFVGRYLTEPKPHVFFEAPEAPPSFAVFARQAQKMV